MYCPRRKRRVGRHAHPTVSIPYDNNSNEPRTCRPCRFECPRGRFRKMSRMPFASTLTCWVVMNAAVVFHEARSFSQTSDGLVRDAADNPIAYLMMEAVILVASYALFRLCRTVLLRTGNGIVSNLLLLIVPAAFGFAMAYCFAALLYYISFV